MNSFKNVQNGFTIIEIAIALVVVTVLLGYTLAMIPVQQELKQYREADAEMNRIISSIYAYAQVNGRLPCADDIANPDGIADPDDGTQCTQWYGLLPAKTLGIDGKYDEFNSLLDPWGTAYRYQVTATDDGDGVTDFVEDSEIRDVGMDNLSPDLVICTVNPSAAANDTSCTNAPTTVANSIPAIVLSLGKDIGTVASDIQNENTDNTADGTTDIVFVKTTRNDTAGTEFDDLIKWISPNILYSKMIEAGQLP